MPEIAVINCLEHIFNVQFPISEMPPIVLKNFSIERISDMFVRCRNAPAGAAHTNGGRGVGLAARRGRGDAASSSEEQQKL